MKENSKLVEKYKALALSCSRKEKEWALYKEKISSMLDSLSIAASGQDSNLDEVLSELRHALEKDQVGAQLIDKVSTSSKALSAIRRSRAEKQLQGFTDCVAQLLLLDPPKEIKQELSTFIQNARRVISRPEQQEVLPLKFANLQSKVLSNHSGQPAAVEALDDSNSIDELVKDDALSNLPPFSNVAEAIENILMDLLVQIRVPDQVTDNLAEARKILNAGLNWYELAALLEQLSTIIIASLRVDQDEFEAFLLALNERLTDIGRSYTGVSSVVDSVFSEGDKFDDGFREEIHSLAGDVDQAKSLPEFQEAVKGHLDQFFNQLDSFKQQRVDQQTAYEHEIHQLKNQLVEMEERAREAQAELESQRDRNERDALTNLPNRFSYERRIEIEFSRWLRYGNTFSLIVVDIDYFKKINDGFGHLAGDKVLKVLAKILKQCIRRTDFIARFGGEEFVILMPETNEDEAMTAMDNVRKKIADTPFHFKSSPLQITASFGVAEIADGEDWECVFGRADEALYRAKAEGRNCCRLAAKPEVKRA